MRFLSVFLICLSCSASDFVPVVSYPQPIAVWTANGPASLHRAVKHAEAEWSTAGVAFRDGELSNIVVIWEKFPAVSFGNLGITISAPASPYNEAKAVIFINGYPTWAPFKNHKWTQRQLNAVVLHEFGHALGLGHTRAVSVMNPEIVNTLWPQHLFQADLVAISKLY